MDLMTHECKHVLCSAQVVDVMVPGTTRGVKKIDTINAQPASWDEGGRIRLLTVQPNADKGKYVGQVCNTTSAFGVTLYRDHAQTCAGKGKR